MHKDTFELVARHWLWMKTDLPKQITVQQIWNSIYHYAPDLQAVISSVKRGNEMYLLDVSKYPHDTTLINPLYWAEVFFECVQEQDALLRNSDAGERVLYQNRPHLRKKD